MLAYLLPDSELEKKIGKISLSFESLATATEEISKKEKLTGKNYSSSLSHYTVRELATLFIYIPYLPMKKMINIIGLKREMGCPKHTIFMEATLGMSTSKYSINKYIVLIGNG